MIERYPESEHPLAEAAVLLIDEIDKADIEFPNDLLHELDKMEFYCYELKRTIKAKQRPIVIITSNNEKELPDAFLRRCFFHFHHKRRKVSTTERIYTRWIYRTRFSCRFQP